MTTLLLSLLAACVYFYECVSIRQKDTGANDRGKMFIQSKKASAADKPKTPEAQPEPAAKTDPLGWILPLCAAVLSFGVWFLHPVSDLYYYGAAILSMAAILVSFISIIHAYNLLSTRRLPQFDKQEVMTVRKIKHILTAFVFCLILSASTIPVCASAVSASNEETGYVYVLDDSADFLTDSQENSLQKQLYDLTAYCNVAFVTTTGHSKSSTEDFAADYFDDVFIHMPTVRSSSLTAA